MEAFLIDAWLGGREAVAILDEASVSQVRQLAREAAAARGLTTVAAERLATIASELAYNQLRHARRGEIALREIERAGNRGLELIAADEGLGIDDPTRALQGIARSSGSLGVGLAAAREHAHEIDLDVRIGEGTCVRARVFAEPIARRREIGIFGRPHRDESRSGDHAGALRDGDRLLVAVCDGLGHGPPARAAANAAMHVFARHHEDTPVGILEECHRTLGPTRGVVMAAATIEGASSLSLASVGNITTELVRPHTSRRFGASSFVVGSQQRAWRAHQESAALTAGDALIMFTDGVTSRAIIDEDLALLREHPVVIAHQLVARFGREDDDALVLVAR